VTVTAPPRPPADDELADREALDALIEEARRRARRRRRRLGAAALLALAAGGAALVGLGDRASSGPGTAAPERAPGAAAGARGLVVVMLRGYVEATRTLHSSGGPVHYRESGRFRVVWRLPAAAFDSERAFASTSAIVTGTTSATYDNARARSCHGTLAVRPQPFLLRIHTGHDALFAWLTPTTTGVATSPNPIASATSAACTPGLLAGRWRLSVPGDQVRPPFRGMTRARRQAWWVYNHPGGGFYGTNFTPLPKGGAGEGWTQGWGTAGSFKWLAVFSIHRTLSHRH
jgi:hypothetical protein